MMKSHSYVIYRSGALGDIVTSFPLLAELRRRDPLAHITLIGPPDSGELAVVSGHVDTLISVDSAWVADWHAGNADVVRERIGTPHLLIIVSKSTDLANTARAAGIENVVTHRALAKEAETEHITDHALKALPDPPAGLAPEIVLDETRLRKARKLVGGMNRFCLLHSGSSVEYRIWPHLGALAGRIRTELDLPLVVNVGPVEAERGIEDAWPDDTRIVGPLTATELAGVTSLASLYVGNDTGPTHVAAATNTPTVAIFGPASCEIEWGPRGKSVEVVAAQSGWPDVDAVFDACKRLMR